MKALIAIDPLSRKGAMFRKFCHLVDHFQSKGVLSNSMVVSLIHPSLYAVPNSWFHELKHQYAKEAEESLEQDCAGKFSYDKITVLQTDKHGTEAHVKQVSRYGQRSEVDLLVTSGTDKRGLPHWVLGSFSETAALTAGIPVLVIKPQLQIDELSRSVSFVVAIDVAEPPTAKQLAWIAKASKQARAKVELVHSVPGKGALGERFEELEVAQRITESLKEFQKKLRALGCSSNIHVLEEHISAAHTVVDFADQLKAWMTITCGSKRSTLKKLFLGPTARRVLTISKRPFLNLPQ